jgi:hypothetical protein
VVRHTIGQGAGKGPLSDAYGEIHLARTGDGDPLLDQAGSRVHVVVPPARSLIQSLVTDQESSAWQPGMWGSDGHSCSLR